MENNWIKNATEQFTKLCNELQERVLLAGQGNLLEESEKFHDEFKQLYASYMRIPDRAKRKVLIDKVLYAGEADILNWDGYNKAGPTTGITRKNQQRYALASK